MEEKRLEDLTINELKKLAESESIELTATKKANIIEEINKAREVDTDDADKEMVEKNVDKDNKKSTDEVNKEIRKDVEIPKGFVKKTNLNKKEYGYYNGRKYKKMKNGYGMWADNGQSFLLSELK